MKYKYLKNHGENTWINAPDVTPTEYIGFVYYVFNTKTTESYIGITRYWENYKLPALKGKKRKRLFKKETHWRQYTTSGTLKDDIEQNPQDYVKCVIRNCKTLTELKAYEAYMVLTDYFNGNFLSNEMVHVRLRLR